MAGHKRYKHIKVNLSHPNLERDKKRHRIRHAVSITWAIMFFSVLLIGGINQHNDIISGWCFIIMGIICIPTTIFYFYMDKKDWKPVFWYDDDSIRSYVDKKEREKDANNYRAVRSFEAFVLLLCSLLLPLLGVFRLLNMI